MKCLFLICGEGRGHATQALALKEILNSIDISVEYAYIGKSDVQRNHDWVFNALDLPQNYYYSPSFVYKNKQVSIKDTIFNAVKNLPTIIKSVKALKTQVRNSGVDFIVNFYEPLTPLVKGNIPVITIGHQYMLSHPTYVNTPYMRLSNELKLNKQLICLFNKWVSYQSKHILALSYYNTYSVKNIKTAPPLLRQDILNASPSIIQNKVTIYVMNSDMVEQILQQTINYPYHKFVIYNEKILTQTFNTSCKLVSSEFMNDLLSSEYVVCSGGFETICESHYHNKKILAVPTVNHTEQTLNCMDAMLNNVAYTNKEYNLDIILNRFNPHRTNRNISSKPFDKNEYKDFYVNFFKSLKDKQNI